MASTNLTFWRLQDGTGVRGQAWREELVAVLKTVLSLHPGEEETLRRSKHTAGEIKIGIM